MEQPTSTTTVQPASLCSICHLPLKDEYYFCPNCGTQAKSPPLSTSLITQLKLYGFSIILPSLCFLFITKWEGINYLRSSDTKARTIGALACALLILSTILTFWYAYSIAKTMVEKTINESTSINLDQL